MNDKELFRLASLIGCEPEDEERHRKQLKDYINRLIAEAKKEICKEALKVDEMYPGGTSLRDFLNNRIYINTTPEELSNNLSKGDV